MTAYLYLACIHCVNKVKVDWTEEGKTNLYVHLRRTGIITLYYRQPPFFP